jgi:hypothetical protein
MKASKSNTSHNDIPVWIIGNGPSQKNWKLKELDGFNYGCNNLYRHFTPDILLAVDPGAIYEIVNSGYKGQSRFTDWNLMLREYDKKYVEHFLSQEEFKDYTILYAGYKNVNNDHFTFMAWEPTKTAFVMYNRGEKSNYQNFVRSRRWSNVGCDMIDMAAREGAKHIKCVGFDYMLNESFENVYVKDKPNVEYNSQAHMQSTDFVPALLGQWKRHSEALEKKWGSKGVKIEYL